MKLSSIIGVHDLPNNIGALQAPQLDHLENVGDIVSPADRPAAVCQSTVEPLLKTSLRRAERLNALVAELSVRHMDLVAMSIFLKCSQSTVRKYVHELLHAAVIVVSITRKTGELGGGKDYQLNPDSLVVTNFLRILIEPKVFDRISARRSRQPHETLASPRYFHIMGDDIIGSFKVSVPHARRDPLVAALFGAANLRE